MNNIDTSTTTTPAQPARPRVEFPPLDETFVVELTLKNVVSAAAPSDEPEDPETVSEATEPGDIMLDALRGGAVPAERANRPAPPPATVRVHCRRLRSKAKGKLGAVHSPVINYSHGFVEK